MKHHLTGTHEHNFEIHNIVLFSQSISLRDVGSQVCRYVSLYDVYCRTNVSQALPQSCRIYLPRPVATGGGRGGLSPPGKI